MFTLPKLYLLLALAEVTPFGMKLTLPTLLFPRRNTLQRHHRAQDQHLIQFPPRLRIQLHPRDRAAHHPRRRFRRLSTLR
jgi:hypothetical protein